MMPGGSVAAWPLVKDIFQAICAKTPEGEACAEWVGSDGAGHQARLDEHVAVAEPLSRLPPATAAVARPEENAVGLYHPSGTEAHARTITRHAGS